MAAKQTTQIRLRHTDSLPKSAASFTARALPDLPRHSGWRSLNGVILLDKPAGATSNQALQWVRRLLSAEKGGHTGTLDPFATGVLPLCLGEATKFSADLLNADKTYEATLSFGSQTDSGDLTGTVVNTTAQRPTSEQLESIRAAFLGEIAQVPPMYSALKRDGQPLYKLARQGIEVERQPRQVTIHSLRWFDIVSDEQGQVQSARLSVCCSKGTYIRTLAEDIAQAVGCLAHLITLRRTQVGAVTLAGCQTVAGLQSTLATVSVQEAPVSASTLLAVGVMQPIDFLVQDLPVLNLSETQAQRCRHGNPFVAEAAQSVGQGADTQLRLYDQGRFLGVAIVQPCEKTLKIQPLRLVSLENT